MSATKQNTHLAISTELVGVVESIGEGTAIVTLEGTSDMAADDRGLVHGGFTFGLADFAAMVAVNDPNVVLGSAESRFLAPVKVGQVMTAQATVEAEKGKKRTVAVTISVADKQVMTGSFTCFVLAKHVFD